MAQNLSIALEPIREKRAYYEAHPERLMRLLPTVVTAPENQPETMESVRAAIKIN